MKSVLNMAEIVYLKRFHFQRAGGSSSVKSPAGELFYSLSLNYPILNCCRFYVCAFEYRGGHFKTIIIFNIKGALKAPFIQDSAPQCLNALSALKTQVFYKNPQ